MCVCVFAAGGWHFLIFFFGVFFRCTFRNVAASKAALARFSESLAKELENSNVTINCVSPGAMKTDLLKELLEVGAHIAGDEEYKLAEKIFNDVGAPMEKVANLILFFKRQSGILLYAKSRFSQGSI